MKKYRNPEQTGRRGSELARQSFRHVLLGGMEERDFGIQTHCPEDLCRGQVEKDVNHHHQSGTFTQA